MSWLEARRGYDRTRLLAGARRAAGRGKHAKAVALYERIQSVEPENLEVLRRLAGQRARAGQSMEGWRDCRQAAERLVEQGFVEQAIGVLRDFAFHIPRELNVWKAISDLELERSRIPDAIAALLEGRSFFKARKHRDDALALLRRARKIDPTHFEANFALANLLVKCGSKAPARRILEELEGHVASGRERRRLRGRLFRLSPGPRSAWRWIRTCFGGN